MEYVRIQQLFLPIVAGVLQVGQLITNYGPDLLTSCGNPGNILSVGTTYVVGIGGPCSAYGEWTQYSRYPTEHRQALSNGCSNSSTVTPTSATTISVRPTPTSGVDNNSSGARGIVFPLDLMLPMAAIMFVVFFVNI